MSGVTSQETSASSGTTDGSSQRFEIYVPSPKARINMGKPNTSSTGPFGYTGLSLQSDVHLFIDANKHTLFQTGQNYCGQVGGQWLQYSNANMFLSSTASMNLSADKKIVIASGAGMGQITALDHGTFPRVVPYNSLGLHYRVDAVDISLFEFFHGRHGREKGKVLPIRLIGTPLSGPDFFDAKKSTEEATEADLKGGFTGIVARSVHELYPHAAAASEPNVTGAKELAKYDGDPVQLVNEWLAHVESPAKSAERTIAGKAATSSLKYGFSPYLKRFDPYALVDTASLSGFGKALAKFRNFLARARRYADVAGKVGNLLTDNYLAKKAINAMDAVNSIAAATWHAYHFKQQGAALAFWRGDDAGPGSFADEANSGWRGRLSPFQTKSDADVSTAQASVRSQAGPWDLSARSSHGLRIVSKNASGKNRTDVVTIDAASKPAAVKVSAIARAVTAAELEITAITIDSTFDTPAYVTFNLAGFTGISGTTALTIMIDGLPHSVALTSSNAPNAASLRAAVASALGPVAAVTLDGTTLRVETASRGASATASVSLLSGQLTAGPTSSPGVDGSAEAVVKIDAGAQQTVRVTRTISAVAASNALTGATATLVGNKIKITSATTGPSSSIEFVSATRTGDTTDNPFDVTNGSLVRGTDSYGGTTTVSVTINGGAAVNVDVSATDTGQKVRDAFNTLTGVTVSGLASDKFTITTTLTGAAASIEVGAHPALAASPTVSRGLAPLDLRVVTAADVFARLGNKGYAAQMDGDAFVLAADQTGNGSKITVTGTATPTIFGAATAENEVTTASAASGFGSLSTEDQFKQLISWNHELQKLPEDTRNLLRPLTNAIQDGVACLSQLSNAMEALGELTGRDLPAGPPEAIGLIAQDGITLGTQDRIVGAGGRGIILVVDGGSGTADHQKFVTPLGLPVEAAIKRVLDGDIIQFPWQSASDDVPKAQLGFQVLSHSTANLWATTSAQVMAMGRAKLSAKLTDDAKAAGGKVTGIGIARLGASYAAEVVGHRKVVIGARALGDEDKTGGRVEVVGQTIALGGMMTGAKDFLKTGGLGIEPPSISDLGGNEHLDKQAKKHVTELDKFAWPEHLRENHPTTQRVFVHAEKETVIVTGPYLVRVDAEKGIMVGTRVASDEATENEIDLDKPHFEITDTLLGIYANKDTNTYWDAEGIGIFHKTGKSAEASALVEDSKVTLAAGSADSLIIKKGEMAVKSAKVNLSGTSEIMIKAGSVKIC